MNHILAGIDGSDASMRAGRYAADLARDTGAKLTLLLVLETPTVLPIAAFEIYAVMKRGLTPNAVAQARAVLDRLEHRLPSGRVESMVEIGTAAETILEKARTLEVDQIVVGARGLGARPRWLLGSVSDRVVHHAACPVTVVH